MLKKIFPLLLVLLTIVFAIYFRFYPKLLPYLDVLARNQIYNEEWKSFKKDFDSKYPDLAAISDAKFMGRLFDERLKALKPELDLKIGQKSAELKSRYQSPQGYVYVNGIDSYYWFRLLENLIKKGHIGDRVLAGNEFDDLIGNMIDSATKKNVHLWLGLIFYKSVRLFHHDAVLEEVVFYVPVFLSILIGIFTFLVAKKLSAGDLGAFLASFSVTLSPFLLGRSVGEWFDTDIYNALFPLLAFCALITAFQSKDIFKRMFFSLVSGVSLACYASTWKGWWFIFDIMLISGLLFVLNQKLALEKTDAVSVKKPLVTLGSFFLLTTGCVIIINGFSVWMDFIYEPLKLATVLKVTSGSMWPNVYQTVAELEKIEPYYLTKALGAPFLFFAALGGILYIFLCERSVRDERYGFGILCLVLWIIAMFYTALEAVRFILLLVVPVGLAFGLTADRFYKFVERNSSRFKKPFNDVVRYLVIVLFSWYACANILKVHNSLIVTVPQMDDYWYQTLAGIRDKTPKDAYINSWWDFGHWFKTIAQRRVLFDGMTQNTPYAYWIASALLTDDENEATAILRMINAHDNKAADILEKDEKLDVASSVSVIRTALKKGKVDAAAYLTSHGFEPFRVQELLSLMFPGKAPDVYFIVSYDMIAKIGPISYIGKWDFSKVDMWFKAKQLKAEAFRSYLEKSYNMTPDEAFARQREIYLMDEKQARKWFSSGLGLYSALSDAKEDDKIVYFDNGLVINLANNHAYVSSEAEVKRGKPKSFVWMRDGSFTLVPQENSTLSFGALVVKEKDKYKGMLLDEEFSKSMLVRLYYFKGEGLKHFKLFSEEIDDKGNAIYVYQVIW